MIYPSKMKQILNRDIHSLRWMCMINDIHLIYLYYAHSIHLDIYHTINTRPTK